MQGQSTRRKPTLSTLIPAAGAPIVADNPIYHRLPALKRYAVDKETGCWNWLGALSSGYGRCKIGNTTVMAHRALYEHHVGPIPQGLFLHHQCGNRRCVNPGHLEPITCAENTRRKPHTHTLLTWETAAEIRDTMDRLCAEYGVRPRTLAAIGERRIWNPEKRPA